jgi:predicted dehydrogenase
MSEVKIGIIGTGRIAVRMIEALKHTDGIRPVAVSSSTKERAGTFSREHDLDHAFGHWEELIASPEVDAVYVANATTKHAEASKAALQAGKPVLCEKPFASSLVDAKAVIEAAGAGNVLFMEGLWTSCLPAWQEARRVIRAGEIGDPVHLFADFSYPASQGSISRLYSTDGGGCLLDRTVYPVSLAVYLFGPATLAHAQIAHTSEGIDTVTSLTLAHETGVIAQLNASMTSKGPNEAFVSGTAGRLTLHEPLLGSERVSVSPHHEQPGGGVPTPAGGIKAKLKSMSAARRVKAAISDLRTGHHSYGTDQYVPMWAHFRDLIRAGKPQSDLVPHSLSLEVARIIEAARRK